MVGEIIANLDHITRKVAPHHTAVLRCYRAGRIQPIDTVQRNGANADEDLIRSWLGNWRVLHRDRLSLWRNNECSHGGHSKLVIVLAKVWRGMERVQTSMKCWSLDQK